MYSLPSTSQSRAPWARAKKMGSPPTARKARTGELTPPGMLRRARAKSSLDLLVPGLFAIAVLAHAFFLGQRLRLPLGARGRDRGIDLLALTLLFALGQPLQRGHDLALLESDQPHALRVATDGRDAVDRHADDLAARGDDHEVVLVGRHAHAHHLAVALGGLDRDN